MEQKKKSKTIHRTEMGHYITLGFGSYYYYYYEDTNNCDHKEDLFASKIS